MSKVPEGDRDLDDIRDDQHSFAAFLAFVYLASSGATSLQLIHQLHHVWTLLGAQELALAKQEHPAMGRAVVQEEPRTAIYAQDSRGRSQRCGW